MNQNLKQVLEKYNWLHDSFIHDVKYYYKKNKIELVFKLFQSVNQNDKSFYIKIIFSNIYQFNFKENYSDYIDCVYLKKIIIDKEKLFDNEKWFCFATGEKEPLISIISKKIDFEIFNS